MCSQVGQANVDLSGVEKLINDMNEKQDQRHSQFLTDFSMFMEHFRATLAEMSRAVVANAEMNRIAVPAAAPVTDIGRANANTDELHPPSQANGETEDPCPPVDESPTAADEEEDEKSDEDEQ